MVEKGKECNPVSPKRKGGRGGAHKAGSCSRTATTEKGDSRDRADDVNSDCGYCGTVRPACVRVKDWSEPAYHVDSDLTSPAAQPQIPSPAFPTPTGVMGTHNNATE